MQKEEAYKLMHCQQGAEMAAIHKKYKWKSEYLKIQLEALENHPELSMQKQQLLNEFKLVQEAFAVLGGVKTEVIDPDPNKKTFTQHILEINKEINNSRNKVLDIMRIIPGWIFFSMLAASIYFLAKIFIK